MGEFKFAVPRLGTAQLKKRNTFSIHFYNAGAPTFGGLSPPPANSAYDRNMDNAQEVKVSTCER